VAARSDRALGKDAMGQPIRTGLGDEGISEGPSAVIGGHAARGRTNSWLFAGDQPFGRASSFLWMRSNSSGVTSAMAVANGTDADGANANGSTLPAATVAALRGRM
jgi:hypothetical protein